MSLQTLVILCFFSLSFLSASPLTSCGAANDGLPVGSVPPDCQRVLGDLVLSGPNSISVSFPVPEQVDGRIIGEVDSLTVFLSVPALRSVGSKISFFGSRLRDFNAPQLETVRLDVYLRSNLFLTTFYVPELRTVRQVDVIGPHNLSAFVAPKLETASISKTLKLLRCACVLFVHATSRF